MTDEMVEAAIERLREQARYAARADNATMEREAFAPQDFQSWKDADVFSAALARKPQDEIVARQAAQAIEIATRIMTGQPYTDAAVYQLAESALYALSFLQGPDNAQVRTEEENLASGLNHDGSPISDAQRRRYAMPSLEQIADAI